WDDIKETIKPRWEQIHKLNIEPKKKSLLWCVLHNAIYTNKFFNIINIKNSPYCNLCKNKIETSSHIFYNCKRANDFWNLAKDFFNTIKKDNIEITIGKRDIIQGLESLKNTIPNHLVVLTLALWEIFRARAEANLTKSSPSGTQIFQRWKAILKRQIIRDWKKIPYKTNPWAKIETKWFAIEPEPWDLFKGTASTDFESWSTQEIPSPSFYSPENIKKYSIFSLPGQSNIAGVNLNNYTPKVGRMFIQKAETPLPTTQKIDLTFRNAPK
ncbi:hypothetical protein BB560_000968, partial [Smittium megazygosporum]